ncbi:hypothetical protein RF11_12454 [Thelohanellus kitauei]|uniref:Uncharacterized protein n=1 Tax=Thelohanellus kitauei TaxID=669202 RepID=A0A0C2MDV5_THEKT|nr:hypothetical protein RF11_12454 [Thelohanellus kitauei]
MTNFLILGTTSKIYKLLITPNGEHLIKNYPIEVVLNKDIILNNSLAYDYAQHHLYTFLDKHITRFEVDSNKTQVLYYTNETISDMIYDPLSHMLIYLTEKKKLKILSLLTSYEHIVSDNITWFRYSAQHR